MTAGHDTDITAYLAARALSVTADTVPADTVTIAKQCLLDWWTLVLAAWHTPDVARLRSYYDTAGSAAGQATMLGDAQAAALESAVMVNGMAGHIMDFDDAHLKSRVHPSIPLWPAILAYAEQARLSGPQIMAAFIAGVEVQSRLAALMGQSHYRRGWHNTATLGTFGATAAIGLLKGLDEGALRRAFGIAATMAAGMHKAFGTAAKPLQVARAAANGLMAAGLAETGFNAPDSVLDGDKGFVQLYADELAAGALRAHDEHWAVRDIVFKYHASCYGTQAPIEAALQLGQVDRSQVSSIRVYVEPQYMTVCNIQAPQSATEAKFSVRHVVALVLAGRDTARGDSYEPSAINDPAVQSWYGLITVHADERLARANARVELEQSVGATVQREVDASRPETDLDRQQERLLRKSSALLEEIDFTRKQVGELHDRIDAVASCGDFSQWMKEYRAWHNGRATTIE